jgi:hypothetical protein
MTPHEVRGRCIKVPDATTGAKHEGGDCIVCEVARADKPSSGGCIDLRDVVIIDRNRVIVSRPDPAWM